MLKTITRKLLSDKYTTFAVVLMMVSLIVSKIIIQVTATQIGSEATEFGAALKAFYVAMAMLIINVAATLACVFYVDAAQNSKDEAKEKRYLDYTCWSVSVVPAAMLSAFMFALGVHGSSLGMLFISGVVFHILFVLHQAALGMLNVKGNPSAYKSS